MKNITYSNNKFFISIWIIFLVFLIAYSVYLLITSSELASISKPGTDQLVPYVSFKIILGIYFFVAVTSIKKIFNKKFLFWLTIAVGLACRIILIPSSPVKEDDYYRYLWDGAVTANGYNPYAYSPIDVMDYTNKNVPDELHQLATESENIIKNVNHAHIRSIYPYLSQLIFAAAYYISPWEYWGWKIILLIFDLILLVFLIRILKDLSLPLIFVSFYWLNPIVIHEFFNAAHMDLLAILFAAIALYFYSKKYLWYSIIFLAIATGFKLWPIVLLPLLLRDVWPDKKKLLKYSAVFSGLVLFIFLPVLVSNLDENLGLAKYASKWINNDAFYEGFKWIIAEFISLTGISAGCVACINRWGIVFLYIIMLYFILKKSPGNLISFFEKALIIIAILYLISPTQFPWYYTWMVPLLAIRPKAALLLYPVLLPLYQLNYLSDYLVYIQHVPVIILFIYELATKNFENIFTVKIENQLPLESYQ